MTEEDLIREHDALTHRHPTSAQYYLDELSRRQQDKQTAQMLRYTRQMLWLTIAMAALTIASLAMTALALLR